MKNIKMKKNNKQSVLVIIQILKKIFIMIVQKVSKKIIFIKTLMITMNISKVLLIIVFWNKKIKNNEAIEKIKKKSKNLKKK